MKPRIRKFLAGLLSLGLLLQAASPLSALAADGSTASEPTLTVTVNDQIYPIDSQTDSITINYQKYINSALTDCTAKIDVAFSGNTYTLTGTFPVTAKITGTGSPNLVMHSDASGNRIAENTLDISGITDFTATAAKNGFSNLTIDCMGNIDITTQAVVCSKLTVTNANNVRVEGCREAAYSTNIMFGYSVNINCDGDVELVRGYQGYGMANNSMLIKTPKKVTIRAQSSQKLACEYGNGYSKAEITAGEFLVDNPSNAVTPFVFKRYPGNTQTYQVVQCKSADQETAVPTKGMTADENSIDLYPIYAYGYAHVYPGEYERYGITMSVYGGNSVSVTSLNRDNVVLKGYSNKTCTLKYEKSANTLTAEEVFKAGNSVTITGNGTSKLVLKKGSDDSLNISKMANVDVTGAVNGYVKVEGCTDDVTIHGSVSGFVSAKAGGTVEIVGSSENALVGANTAYESTVTAKSLLLENKGSGNLGSVKFTKLNSSSTYLVVTGKSGDESTRTSETMSGNTYSIAKTDDISYLYIYEVTPPAAETLTVKVNGVSQTINSYSTGIDGTNVKVKFNNTSKTYTLTGTFDDNAKVEIIGANIPNLVLDLTTGQLDSLNLVGLGDVHISSTDAVAVTASGLTVSATSLTVNNTVGNVGTVKFTPIGSGDYNVTTGTSETNTDEPEPLQNGAYNATVNKGYLSITSGKVYADPQLIVTVNGTRYELNPDSTELTDGVAVAYQNGVYTLSGHLVGDVTITGKAYKSILPGLKWVGTSSGRLYYDVEGAFTVENVDGFQWDINYYGAKALKLENCGTVNITGHGFVTTGETLINGAADVTLTTSAPNGNALGGNEGNVTINCTGAVTLTNETGALAGNTLTITTPGNVTLNANSRDTLNVVGSLNVTAHKLIVDNTGSASVGTVTFNGATADYAAHISKTYKEKTIDIPNGTTVKSRYLYVGPESEYVAVPSSDPTLAITVGGKNYTIDSETEKIEELGITVQYGNGEYTLTGSFNGLVSVTGTPCNGKKPSVNMKNENGAVVVGSLNVSDVEDFSAEGRGIVNGNLKVTASGKVKLDAGNGSIVDSGSHLTVSTTGSVSLTGSGSNSQLISEEAEAAITAGKLTAQNPGGKIGTITFTPSSGSGCLVNDKKTELDENGTITVSDADMADDDAQLVVEIDPSTIPSDSTSSGNSGSAGGAVAAVMVGGVAVWGGYQVATRIILHKLLPEGAAIPANRGQLALLVWNAAGRPEPAAAPAFTDVADADTAKAAQWCAEQGYLDAKTESTFKPNGLVTKVKVIKVWSKAFPTK